MEGDAKERKGVLGSALAAVSAVLLVFGVGPVHSEERGANAFAPAVDTPIKKAPRPIIGALREPLDKLPQVENFKLVGHNPLPNPGGTIARGRNGPIGISGNCLYVGNRIGRRTGTGPTFGTSALPPEVLIVDISNPRKPEVVGAFQTPVNATSRELRAVEGLRTLFVMNFRDAAPADTGDVNNIQIYDISSCREPQLRGVINLGTSRPHEFFTWLDPNSPSRVLLYVSFSGGTDVPDLRVFEVLNPPFGAVRSEPIATFTLDPAVPRTRPVNPDSFADNHFVFTRKPTTQATNVHSMSVSQDGTRVYMANRGHGFYILDSSHLARGTPCTPHTVTLDATTNTDPNLCLRKINPDPNASYRPTPPYGGITHSAVPVPGRPYVVVGGERNGTNTCPWTWGHIFDVTDETNPQVTARYMVPENVAENCFVGGPGDPVLQREFSTHQITAFPNLFIISWYSAGLRVWDISNPSLPVETGVFVPRPEEQVVERFRNSPDVWVWPYPILHNGLVYITDENSGLYILKYTGQRAEELPPEGTFVGNINRPPS